MFSHDVIEKNVALSQSQIWSMQMEYYHRKTISAWERDVPYFITSNNFIAAQYAQAYLAFMKDQSQQAHHDPSQAFHILELGTGTGTFSFYLLNQLNHYQRLLGYDDLKWIYIMTDFTQNNIDFWKKHRQLEPFIRAKQLDFAQFNCIKPAPIKLQLQQTTIHEKSLKNPLLVCANYLIDTIPHDAFYTQQGQLHLVKTHVTQPKKNKKNQDLSKVNIRFSRHPVSSQLYPNHPDRNAMLAYYTTHLKKQSFSFTHVRV